MIGTWTLLQLGCVENSFFDDDDQVGDTLLVEERFEQAPLPAVDILWIVDDTASMAEEHAALADGFAAFLASLEGEDLAYQVGVVTTDPGGTDGAALQGEPWIITPELDDPVGAFADAVDVGLDGTAQAGLGALVLALSEPLTQGDNRGFRRSDAALLAVVVSDDDDSSHAVLGDDPVAAALDFLEDQASDQGEPARLSAIVGDDPGGCSGRGGAALPGTAYAQVAAATGGEVLSICAAELDALVGSLGALAVAWPDTFPLQALPLDGTVQVRVDGKRAEDGWFLQESPPAIVFDVSPPAGAWILVGYALPASAEEP